MSERRTRGAPKAASASPEEPEVLAPNGAKFGPVLTSGELQGYRMTDASPGSRPYALSPAGDILEVSPARSHATRASATRTVSRTEDTEARLMLAQPETYRLYDVPTKDYLDQQKQTIESQRGRPRRFPPALFSAIAALRKPLGPTLEATLGKINTTPGMIEDIWAGVAAHSTYPLTECQTAAMNANLIPHRSTVIRAIHQRYSIDDLSESYGQIAVKAALELGYFSGGALDDLHNHVHCDGSVLLSPSKAREVNAIDPKTGKVRRQRVDPARGHYHEGGGNKVVGAKYTYVAVARHGASPGFALAVEPVLSSTPSAEFKASMAAFARIHGILANQDQACARRPVSIVVDGAPTRGQIQTMITEYDTLVSSPPHRAEAAKQGSAGREKQSALNHLPACRHCSQRDHLILIGSLLARRIPVKNAYHDQPVPFTLKRVKRANRNYYYLTFDCTCGGQRRIPFRQLAEEPDKAYLARVELMRAWSKTDPQWKAVYQAHRAKVENSNMLRDRRYPFKRIPAWGRQAQHALQTHEEFGTVVLALADHRNALKTSAPPGELRPTEAA